MWKHARDYYPIKVTGYPPQRHSSSSLSSTPTPTPTHPCLCPLGSLNSDSGAWGRGCRVVFHSRFSVLCTPFKDLEL